MVENNQGKSWRREVGECAYGLGVTDSGRRSNGDRAESRVADGHKSARSHNNATHPGNF